VSEDREAILREAEEIRLAQLTERRMKEHARQVFAGETRRSVYALEELYGPEWVDLLRRMQGEQEEAARARARARARAAEREERGCYALLVVIAAAACWGVWQWLF
jgi:hypothetical protein